MGKRAVAITPTSRFSNRRIDNVWWMFSLVTCTCLVSFHCLDWAFGDELWDTGGIQQLCNLIMMQPIPLKCNRIQQVCCHRMPWTQHLNLWRVMDRLHNIQSPDYIQQPELLCLAGAWGSGTFAGVRSLPHLATYSNPLPVYQYWTI